MRMCTCPCVLFSVLLYIMHILYYVHFAPLQISEDLDRSMNEVFMKYDGESSESKAADYLQTQVCCSWCFSPPFLFKSRVPLSCLLSLLCCGILGKKQSLCFLWEMHSFDVPKCSHLRKAGVFSVGCSCAPSSTCIFCM